MSEQPQTPTLQCLETHINKQAIKQATEDWENFLKLIMEGIDKVPTGYFKFVIHGGPGGQHLTWCEQKEGGDALKTKSKDFHAALQHLRQPFVVARAEYVANKMALDLIEKANIFKP